MKFHAMLGLVVLFCATSGFGNTIIADWTFETSHGSSAGPFSPEIGSGSAFAHHSSTTATYPTASGNGSSYALSSTAWAVGDYYQFSVSTLGLDDINVSFDQNSGTTTGPRDFNFQYSIDGTNFTTFSSYSVFSTTWSSTNRKSGSTITENLSSVTTLNNKPTIYIRLTDRDTKSVNNQTVSSTTPDLVDNVIISGDVVAVPLPSAAWAGIVLSGLLGIARHRRRSAWIC